MAMWQIMFGVGAGLLVAAIAFFTTRPLEYTNNRRRKVSFVESPDNACPICLMDLNNDGMHYFMCGHAVHDECFQQMIKNSFTTCPKCKNSVR